ncbi:MAG: polysaccharide deacetylase family protein [Planctomycetes bacterium]|nr:polysaccharide deacetylase family protein [Planctomycetota bacterium]
MATSLVFLALFALWRSRRYAWWVPSVSDSHPRILMYHMICVPLRSHKYRGLRVAPAMFERQLAWMSAEGWNFVTMSQLREQYESLPPKTVAITFDDGFLDNYTEALPLLKRYQAKATLYLLIDRHDNEWQTRRKAHHNSGEILREQKLSDDHVREMLDSGVFELGGHTIRHINLAAEDLATKTHEVVEGRHQLQEQFGVPVDSFAYPFGIYGDDDVQLVRQAGFTSAVTVEEGIDTDPDFMRLKRIKVSGKDRFLSFKTRMRIGKRGY